MCQQVKTRRGIRAFTMIEMMAVVMLILIMTAASGLAFFNSRDATKIKRDAAQTISFMRNMWDRAKTSGSALILEPDFEKGTLSYVDPRSGVRDKAELASGAQVLGIKINDRLYNLYSHQTPGQNGDEGEFYDDEDYNSGADVLYLSEGRGLSRLAVIFAIPDDKESESKTYSHLTVCSLNLITGKGTILDLDPDKLDELMNGDGEAGQNGPVRLDRDAIANTVDGEDEGDEDGDD